MINHPRVNSGPRRDGRSPPLKPGPLPNVFDWPWGLKPWIKAEAPSVFKALDENLRERELSNGSFVSFDVEECVSDMDLSPEDVKWLIENVGSSFSLHYWW